jgi:NAD(P)-dependent dehydrogenase (short-subunit alcohol dehydrogenase family)
MKSLQEGFAAFEAEFGGKLDICVPCAGINKNVTFLDTTFEEHEKLIGVNVMGVYHTAQLGAKLMIKNGTKVGSIILVASIASYMAIRSQRSTAYCGTKGAVRAMGPAIAAELNQYGIRCNSISPGYVRTEMTAPVSARRGLPLIVVELTCVQPVPRPVGRMEGRDHEWPCSSAGRYPRWMCFPGVGCQHVHDRPGPVRGWRRHEMVERGPATRCFRQTSSLPVTHIMQLSGRSCT